MNPNNVANELTAAESIHLRGNVRMQHDLGPQQVAQDLLVTQGGEMAELPLEVTPHFVDPLETRPIDNDLFRVVQPSRIRGEPFRLRVYIEAADPVGLLTDGSLRATTPGLGSNRAPTKLSGRHGPA